MYGARRSRTSAPTSRCSALASEYEIVADLPGEWRFLEDDEALGIGHYTAVDWDDSDWDTIRIDDYMQRQGRRFRGIGWYRCWFDLPKELEGKKIGLLLPGVSTKHFYVNGRWLPRERKNGVWIVDFTDVAKFGEKNLITLGIVTTGQPGGVYKPVRLAVKK